MVAMLLQRWCIPADYRAALKAEGCRAGVLKLVLACTFSALGLGGCATSQLGDVFVSQSGAQFDSSPVIQQAARGLGGATPEQQVRATVTYVNERFRHDPWLNSRSLSRSASTLFESGSLSGCAEYAVVAASLLRAQDIPTRLLLSVNDDWVQARRSHPFLIPRGHVFLEVKLDGAWRLLDVPYRNLYRDYSPLAPALPRDERFCLRTADFWEHGIRGAEHLVATFTDCADRQPDVEALPPEPAATPL